MIIPWRVKRRDLTTQIGLTGSLGIRLIWVIEHERKGEKLESKEERLSPFGKGAEVLNATETTVRTDQRPHPHIRARVHTAAAEAL